MRVFCAQRRPEYDSGDTRRWSGWRWTGRSLNEGQSMTPATQDDEGIPVDDAHPAQRRPEYDSGDTSTRTADCRPRWSTLNEGQSMTPATRQPDKPGRVGLPPLNEGQSMTPATPARRRSGSARPRRALNEGQSMTPATPGRRRLRPCREDSLNEGRSMTPATPVRDAGYHRGFRIRSTKAGV